MTTKTRKTPGMKIGFVGLTGTWKFFNIATAKRFDLGSIGTLYITSRNTFILLGQTGPGHYRPWPHRQITETAGQDLLERLGY